MAGQGIIIVAMAVVSEKQGRGASAGAQEAAQLVGVVVRVVQVQAVRVVRLVVVVVLLL